MKKQTQAIHTRFQHRDAYNALSMPVYHTAAYEFEDAVSMSDAFCGRTDAPDYSRVMNPTVTFFDFMVDGTDNFAVKFLINDACVMSGKPFSHGGYLSVRRAVLYPSSGNRLLPLSFRCTAAGRKCTYLFASGGAGSHCRYVGNHPGCGGTEVPDRNRATADGLPADLPCPDHGLSENQCAAA